MATEQMNSRLTGKVINSPVAEQGLRKSIDLIVIAPFGKGAAFFDEFPDSGVALGVGDMEAALRYQQAGLVPTRFLGHVGCK